MHIARKPSRMSGRDEPDIAAVEQAIAKKYGTEAIQNPNAAWNPEREKAYQVQLESVRLKKYELEDKNEKVEVDGVLIPKKLLNRGSSVCCSVCELASFSFRLNDDACMTKFGCCFGCYIQWIEGREERWLSGWRPDKNH